jgi:hypothetical protein
MPFLFPTTFALRNLSVMYNICSKKLSELLVAMLKKANVGKIKQHAVRTHVNHPPSGPETIHYTG